jgi:hypothetical protein
MEVIERNARAQAKLVEEPSGRVARDDGKLRLNFKAMKLGDVVCAAVDAVRPIAEEKQVCLECATCSPTRTPTPSRATRTGFSRSCGTC